MRVSRGGGDTSGAALAPHAAGEEVLAPVLLDTGARGATCRLPAQHALAYGSDAAATCIETIFERDLALGADGTWLDNLGANVYGAKSAHGHELRSFHLQLANGDGGACVRERSAALSSQATYAEVLAFKDCAFSLIAQQQASRLRIALQRLSARIGRRPQVYGNGLKHSFYWTAGDMAAMRRALYGGGGGTLASGKRDESPPFGPDPTERVIYFAVNGTQGIMAPTRSRTATSAGKQAATDVPTAAAAPPLPAAPALLDGFNMESFFGFIASKLEHSPCSRWPTANWTSLQACGFEHVWPGAPFWHANVRVMAHAARRGYRALAKIGQAGWKGFGQELLPPVDLHRWFLGAYASFLMTVDDLNGSVALGVHPFARRPGDGLIVPWLHPALFLDIGRPIEREEVIERYRPRQHSSYVRRFERGVAVYNPAATTDVDVPLGGGAYVNPWAQEQAGAMVEGGVTTPSSCSLISSVSMGPQQGRLLVARELLREVLPGKRPHRADELRSRSRRRSF